MIKSWQGEFLVLAVLISFGIFNNAQATTEIDTEAPVIESLEMSPVNVDTTDGEQKVLITMHVKDAGTGINNVSLNFTSPSNNNSRSAGLFFNQYDGTYQINTNSYPYEAKNALLNGTSTDGIFQAELILPQYSEAGTWKLNNISASDVNNNYSNYGSWNNFEGLNMANIATEILNEATIFDASAPTIESLEMSPVKVNTTDGEQKILITMHLKDNVTGVNNAYLNFTSPSGNNSKSAGFSFNYYDGTYTMSSFSYPYEAKNALLSGASTDGVFQVELVLPQYSEAGIWKLSNISIADRINNFSNYSNWNNFEGLDIATEILNEAAASDSGAPTLESLEFLPTTVDASTGNKKVVVRMHLIDDNTGVSSANLFFASPSGGSSLMAGFYFNAFTGEYPIISMTYPYEPTNALISGSSTDGIFEAELIFPPSSEIGDWKLSSINISDKINNNRYYSQWDNFGGLNIPTSVNNGTAQTPIVTTTGITVKTPPTKTTYTSGENLDLSGLVVTLSKSDGSTQDVTFADFFANNITTDKANSAVLSVGDSSIKIVVNSYETNQAIVVNAAQTSISTAAIFGISAPATGAVPTSSISDTDEYTATISWNGNPTTFDPSTAYTAIIIITPKIGYTLSGVSENFFAVADAVATNSAGSGVVTAVFPTTSTQGQAMSGANGSVHITTIQEDGKIIIGGQFSSYDGIVRNRIARLNTDGTLDTTFASGFEPIGMAGEEGISAMAIQQDGKIIASGWFTTFNGESVNNIVRINIDGSLDTTFNAGTGLNYAAVAIAVQSDGKIIINNGYSKYYQGSYDVGNIYNGAVVGKIARLNIDGTLDETFALSFAGDNINTMTIQSDDKIIIGGNFSSYNGKAVNHIVRLNANGIPDSSFNYSEVPNGLVAINDIVVQSNGKLVIGYLTNYGTSADNIARLNSDGTLDRTFSYDMNLNNTLSVIAIQPNDKVIIGGHFTTSDGSIRNSVARLNSDGTQDASFFSGMGISGGFSTITVQSDYKLIIGGDFTLYNGLSNTLARLNPDGTLDTTFNSGISQISQLVAITNAVSDIDATTAAGWGNIVATGGEDPIGSIEWGTSPGDYSMGSCDAGKTSIGAFACGMTGLMPNTIYYVRAKAINSLGTSYGAEVKFTTNSDSSGVWSSTIDLNDVDASKNNLVVITHGLCGSATDDWVTRMRNAIYAKSNPDDTAVRLFDWKDGAGSNFICPPGDPSAAYNNAVNFGHGLAIQIEWQLSRRSDNQSPMNLHLIAHSAGSNLIQTVVDDLAEYFRTHNDRKKPSIHLTFLDAYAPKHENERYGELYNFSGYAEQYVDTAITPDLPDTNIILPNAINFDVTQLTNISNRTHTWPIDFYNESINNPSSYNIGFNFSNESLYGLERNYGLNGYTCNINDLSQLYTCQIGPWWDVTRETITPSLPTVTIISPDSDKINNALYLNYISLKPGSTIDNTSEVTTNMTNIIFQKGIASITVPFFTQIEKADQGDFSADSSNFNFENFAAQDVTVSVQQGMPGVMSAIKIGVNNTKLSFSNPVTISINVDSIDNGRTLNVLYQNDGETTWQSQGTCLIVDGKCTFTTMHATTYAVINDSTPPTTTISVSGTGGPDWFRSDVQVALTAIDNEDGSGMDKTEYSLDDGTNWVTYANPFTISHEGNNKVEFRSTDKAGNVENVQIIEIKIDKTAPGITINTPADGAQYVLKSTINADWSVTDELSGIDKSIGTITSGSPINTSSVGSKSFSVTTTDLAGNSITKTVKYSVVYAFGGFQDPITKDNKAFNGNNTVPVKFQLTDANGGYISNAIASIEIDGKTAVASGDSNSGNAFRYDSLTNQYIFNLSAKNSSLGVGTHILKITLDDGTTYSQDIVIK